MKVEIQNSKYDITLIQSVIAIWKQKRYVMKKGSTDIKFRNKIRHVSEEDECYLDEDYPFKRTSLQGDKYDNLVITNDHIRFKEKTPSCGAKGMARTRFHG